MDNTLPIPVLSIQHLSVSVGEKEIVHQICFQIPPNSVTALVGESGSGKSLTALSLLQLLPKQISCQGQILFQEQNQPPIDLQTVTGKALQAIRGNKVAMIFQEPMTSLNPMLSIGDQVSEVLRIHKKLSAKQSKQECIALLESVELPDSAAMYHRFPHELSGGQKQRVMIAMAIACKPTLLIADEPTTALDVLVQKGILQLLKKQQARFGMSVLLITHDLGVVADMADQVLVMQEGRIVEQGSVTEILKNPSHPYTQSLLHARNLDDLAEHSHKPIPTTSPFLEVRNLSLSYPLKKNGWGGVKKHQAVLKDINLSVEKGELLGIVGESGSGKSTLGKCILGLQQSFQGKILFEGKPLEAQKESQKVQIVFQDPFGSLNPLLTIGDAILEPMRVHKLYQTAEQQQAQLASLLEAVNLDPSHAYRYPHEFSGGQRQRICIARALSVNPALLIFDESLSALDMSLQKQMVELILALKAERAFTGLFISHDLYLVSRLCNRVAVMQQGRIIEMADANHLFSNPQEAYTQSLLDAIPGKEFFRN